MRIFIILLIAFFTSTAFAKNGFSITSTAFKDGETIPTQYTCAGKDISPQLSWSGIPDKTQSLALIVSDPDAPIGTFYHWVVFNIPKATQDFKEGIQDYPQGTIIGTNNFNKVQYNGPCPPPGKPHHYIFTLYALDSNMTFPERTDAKILQDAMKKHILDSTEVTGLFEKK